MKQCEHQRTYSSGKTTWVNKGFRKLKKKIFGSQVKDENVKKALSEVGSRHTIYDDIESLNVGIGNKMKGSSVEDGYIDEKLNSIKKSTDNLIEDVNIWRERQKKK